MGVITPLRPTSLETVNSFVWKRFGNGAFYPGAVSGAELSFDTAVAGSNRFGRPEQTTLRRG